MTVEERTQTVIAEIGRYSESSEIRALIEKALRDQIEECAQIAEGHRQQFWNAPSSEAMDIARKIRARS